MDQYFHVLPGMQDEAAAMLDGILNLSKCKKGFGRNWYEGSAKERHKEHVHPRKRRVREEVRKFVYQH